MFCATFIFQTRSRLLYTLLGKEQGVEYDKVFYTDKDGVEHEVKKEEPYH